MRSASSRPLWLLLSLVAAFGVLAWSAQREPPRRAFPEPASSTTVYTYGPAGKGYFRRQPITVISGIDTVTHAGASTSCLTFTWGRGVASTTTVSPCPAGRSLRKLP